MADYAAERRLDVGAWTAEAVVQVQVAEGCIHVVPPQQSDHPAAKPDALGIAGWPVQQARRLGELVNPALRLFGRFGLAWRLLVAGLAVPALCQGRGRS